jgi:eukaryotic-like serine/threonine-protein kinase
MQPLPQIPGYELTSRLGGGPLTSVYAGRDVQADRPCAVKVLRPEWEAEPSVVKLLQREARVGLAVKHARLVRVLDAHVTRPPYFLVMELVQGESLRKRLGRDYRLDLATSLWVTRQTAEALAKLHRAGFIHGDVKPDNIRLIDTGRAVLIDLGFAHRPGENDHFLDQGYVLGTVNYLAPELCGPAPDDTPAGDLFSLGVTLFETLSGRLPYPRGTAVQTLRRHAADPPADIRRHVRDLPSELAALIDRLLARRPQDRPAATAVVQRLINLEIATLGRRLSA